MRITQKHRTPCITYKRKGKICTLLIMNLMDKKTSKMDMTTFITYILFSFLLFPANKHHPFFMSNQPQLIIFLPINKLQLSLQLHSKHFSCIFHSESLWKVSYFLYKWPINTDNWCFLFHFKPLHLLCNYNLLQLSISYYFIWLWVLRVISNLMIYFRCNLNALN